VTDSIASFTIVLFKVPDFVLKADDAAVFEVLAEVFSLGFKKLPDVASRHTKVDRLTEISLPFFVEIILTAFATAVLLSVPDFVRDVDFCFLSLIHKSLFDALELFLYL
jgi:hypothetical protein